MGQSCTRAAQVSHFKYCIFDLLVLKSLRMICRQSRGDMSVDILNPITTQVYQKYLPQKYSHPHKASYSVVSRKRIGAKSLILKSLSIWHMLKLEELQKKTDRQRAPQSRFLMSARKNGSS